MKTLYEDKLAELESMLMKKWISLEQYKEQINLLSYTTCEVKNILAKNVLLDVLSDKKIAEVDFRRLNTFWSMILIQEFAKKLAKDEKIVIDTFVIDGIYDLGEEVKIIIEKADIKNIVFTNQFLDEFSQRLTKKGMTNFVFNPKSVWQSLKVSNFTNDKKLMISNPFMVLSALTNLGVLSAFINLGVRSLDLSHAKNISFLLRLIENKNLEELILANCSFDECEALDVFLQNNPNIRRLDLSGIKMTEEKLKIVCRKIADNAENLEYINLTDVTSDINCAKSISEIFAKCYTLTRIDFVNHNAKNLENLVRSGLKKSEKLNDQPSSISQTKPIKDSEANQSFESKDLYSSNPKQEEPHVKITFCDYPTNNFHAEQYKFEIDKHQQMLTVEEYQAILKNIQDGKPVDFIDFRAINDLWFTDIVTISLQKLEKKERVVIKELIIDKLHGMEQEIAVLMEKAEIETIGFTNIFLKEFVDFYTEKNTLNLIAMENFNPKWEKLKAFNLNKGPYAIRNNLFLGSFCEKGVKSLCISSGSDLSLFLNTIESNRLEEVTFADCIFENCEAFEGFFKQNPNIKSLDFSNTEMSSAFLQEICFIIANNLEKIEYVNFSNCVNDAISPIKLMQDSEADERFNDKSAEHIVEIFAKCHNLKQVSFVDKNAKNIDELANRYLLENKKLPSTVTGQIMLSSAMQNIDLNRNN